MKRRRRKHKALPASLTGLSHIVRPAYGFASNTIKKSSLYISLCSIGLSFSNTIPFVFNKLGQILCFSPKKLDLKLDLCAALHLEMMMNPKKLMKKLAATRSSSSCSRSTVASKGHFVAYTRDCERFVLPLTYLCNPIFQALLEVSEEEYGLRGNGSILLPCDGVCMEYLVSLMQTSLSEDLQKALLQSITTARCLTSSLVQQELHKQQPVSSW